MGWPFDKLWTGFARGVRIETTARKGLVGPRRQVTGCLPSLALKTPTARPLPTGVRSGAPDDS